jgi:hypothetical protein
VPLSLNDGMVQCILRYAEASDPLFSVRAGLWLCVFACVRRRTCHSPMGRIPSPAGVMVKLSVLKLCCCPSGSGDGERARPVADPGRFSTTATDRTHSP